MIITVVVWLYISMLCWLWGNLILYYLKSNILKQPIYQPLVCFLGLAVIGTILSWISLLFPLKGFILHLLLLAPVSIFYFVNNDLRGKVKSFINDFKELEFQEKLLFYSFTVLILVMSSWIIIHPDTLIYHTQIIKWIEEYKVVPGLANLNEKLGLQSAWYILSASFSFNFINPQPLTFVNSIILIWFALFFTFKTRALRKKIVPIEKFFWFLLFALAIWDYNQIRLTATSAGNDFVTAIYSWIAILLFYTTKSSINRNILITVFVLFAITLKLSALPLIAFPVYFTLHSFFTNKKQFLILITLIPLFISPILLRNFFTSGYLLFPAAFSNVGNPDWKVEKGVVVEVKDYIKAWAMMPGIQHDDINQTINLPFSSWFPYWWRLKSGSEKTIIILLISLVILSIFNLKYFKVQLKEKSLVLAILILSLIFWFFNGPDVRFGISYLIPLIVILFTNNWNNFQNIANHIKYSIFKILQLIFSLIMIFYTTYRLYYFFSSSNIIFPSGVKQSSYKILTCNDVTFYNPLNGECSNAPLPCIQKPCSEIKLRGKTLEEGFRKP